MDLISMDELDELVQLSGLPGLPRLPRLYPNQLKESNGRTVIACGKTRIVLSVHLQTRWVHRLPMFRSGITVGLACPVRTV